MSHQVTLRFEDGATHFIQCLTGESVADAALRAKIAIPLDCRDGVCGTCKATCESGQFVLGDYVPDALSDDEVNAGHVLTCQMRPSSDCVVQIAATSDAVGISSTAFTGRITACEALSPTAITFSAELENRSALRFLPGQYVNVQVPGSTQTRSYSFSSGPSANEVSFLIRNVPQGLMSSYLREQVKPGDAITFLGPMGSFYLLPSNARFYSSRAVRDLRRFCPCWIRSPKKVKSRSLSI